MDSGLFERKYPLSQERKEAAIREVQKMGYEFHVSEWEKKGAEISIMVQNCGVAPFYHDWSAELFTDQRQIATFDLRKILPGEKAVWKAESTGSGPFRIRVKNPMPGGKPLRFANAEQGPEWLVLPKVE